MQAGRLHIQPAVQVLSLRGGHRELLVELLHEPGQEGVAGTHVRDAGKAQLPSPDNPAASVGSFYSSLGLAGVRAQDLDVQLRQCTAQLRHVRAALRIRPVHAKDGVLVGVESGRAAMRHKITVQRFEVGSCALAGNESQLHQLARGVIDEDQQRAVAALLEPAMIASINLDEFAVALATVAGTRPTNRYA